MAIYPSYFLSSYSFFLPFFLFFFFLFLVFLAFFFRVLCNLFPVQTDHHLASLSSSDHHHHLFSFFISSSCYHHHQRSSSSSRCCCCQCRWRCSSCFCWVLWQFTLLSPFPPAAIAVPGEFSSSSPWRRSSFSLTVFPVAVIFILLLPVSFRWTQAREGDVFGAATTCAVFILQFSSSSFRMNCCFPCPSTEPHHFFFPLLFIACYGSSSSVRALLVTIVDAGRCCWRLPWLFQQLMSLLQQQEEQLHHHLSHLNSSPKHELHLVGEVIPG